MSAWRRVRLKVVLVPNDTPWSTVRKYLSFSCGVNAGVWELSSSLLAEWEESTPTPKSLQSKAASEFSLLPNFLVKFCSKSLLILTNLGCSKNQEAGSFQRSKVLENCYVESQFH